MADQALKARSALHGVLHDSGAAAVGVTVSDLDGTGLASVQAFGSSGAALAEQVRARYGLALPEGPRRVEAGGTAFLGTGPGRWFASRDAGGNDFATALAAQLDGLAAVADQSAGYAMLRLQGPALRQVFAKGVNIDLHPDAFAVGDVAATAIAHIGVTLWRLDDGADGAPVFELALFRSMAGSFWHWLSLSAGEWGLRAAARG